MDEQNLMKDVEDSIMSEDVSGLDDPQKIEGIGEVVDVALFVGGAANLAAVYEGITLESAMSIITDIAPSFLAAMTGIGKVPAQLADMDDEERQSVLLAFERKFSIPNDKLEAVVEKALEVTLHIVQLYSLFRELVPPRKPVFEGQNTTVPPLQ